MPAAVIGVAELKRLRLIRELCEEVDLWRVKAPHLSYARAILALGQAIREAGTKASSRIEQR